MNKWIVIPSHNRPNYLRETLRHLALNSLTNWGILFGQNPTNESAECLEVIRNFAPGINKGIFLWGTTRDVRRNPFELLEYTFLHLDASLALFIEDDVIVSQDATNLAEWYATNAPEYPTLHLHSGMQGKDAEEDPRIIKTQPRFINTLGVVYLRTHWLNKLRHWWFDDNHKYNDKTGIRYGLGYDFSLAGFSESLHLPTLYSAVARSNHIGHEGGTHTPKEWSIENFANRKIYSGEPIRDFKIER